MPRPPSGPSEWTASVEAAVQAELLRRSRLLKWAVALSLLVGALAVALAVMLRGVTWEEIAPRVTAQTAPLVQQRLAPVITTQITQGQAQIDLSAELGQLEAEVQRLRADLETRRAARDPEVAALRQRVVRLEQALNDAWAAQARLAARVDGLSPAGGSALTR